MRSTLNSILRWFEAGGPIMIILSVLGCVLALLIVERLFALYANDQHNLGHLKRTKHLGLIRALVMAAPLLGLLGTVTGIITTFDSIMLGGQASLSSQGISEALLTTQYALVIAAPGLLLERLISRRADFLQSQQKVSVT